jgi:hypothetical protein
LPSVDRYIVMGDIAMRLRSVTPFSVYGVKRFGIRSLSERFSGNE